MFFVYILYSKQADRFYTGQTKNIVTRVRHHNSNKARWTIRFQPWELVYKEETETRSLAMKREKYLKNLDSLKLTKLISGIVSNSGNRMFPVIKIEIKK